jgi:hypothetical protein
MANKQRAPCAQKTDSQKTQTVIGYAPSSPEVAENIRRLAAHTGRTEQETVQWLVDTSPAEIPLAEQGGLGRALAGLAKVARAVCRTHP